MGFFPDYVSEDTQVALDDAIHDWAMGNEEIDTSGETDTEVIEEIRSNAASDICNQGPWDQIRTLAKWGMEKSAIAALVLDDPKLSHHARLALIRMSKSS